MAKCLQIDCEEEGHPYEFEGNTYILCSYHKNQVSDVIRTQRGIGTNNNYRPSEDDYEGCKHCSLSDGKTIARFNKRTQECEFEICDYYPHRCAGKYCHNKVVKAKQTYWGGKSKYSNTVYCSENCAKSHIVTIKCHYCKKEIKEKEYYQANNSQLPFCSSSHGESYLKEQKEKQLAEMRKFSAHMKTNKSLTELYTNWESVATDFPQDIKDILYGYQKNIEKSQGCAKKIEELEEEDNISNNKSSTNFNYSSSFDNKVNDFEKNSQESINSSQSNNNSNPATSSSSNKPPTKLEIDPSSYRFSDSNSEQDANFRKAFKDILEEINKDEVKEPKWVTIPDNLSRQQRTFLDMWRVAQFNDCYIDIGEISLPKDKKKELYELFKACQVKNFSMSSGPNVKMLIFFRIGIIGLIISLIAIPIVLVIRKRRLKKLQQDSK